ncbi:nucleolar protein 8 isoform X1 [Hydra vulgaris]|uniref:nucleolar protein 8 isoform X1 n=1 Tax=Hydra vulgaris TaxID=6087 RepID=UPI001F5E5E89|nr:nucleolar protein 8 [Hydra vulgaris]
MEDSFRVFVGGLFSTVTEADLRDRFESFGEVKAVQLIQRKSEDGYVSKTFGYVTLMTTMQKLNKCFALFGGTKWNGHDLKVQLAKEDFITRLKKEWGEPQKPRNKRKIIQPIKSYNEILETSAKMKKALPGTIIEGEKNWVMGKYGRPLPVVYIRNPTNKIVKVDPSKHCHCLKKINLDTDEKSISDLLWSVDNDKTDIKQNNQIVKKKSLKQKGNDESLNVSATQDNKELYCKIVTEKNENKITEKNSLHQLKSALIISEENEKKYKRSILNHINDIDCDKNKICQLLTNNDEIKKLNTSTSNVLEYNNNNICSLNPSKHSCEDVFQQNHLSDSIVSQLTRNNFNQVNLSVTPVTVTSNELVESANNENTCHAMKLFDFSFDSLVAKNSFNSSSSFNPHLNENDDSINNDSDQSNDNSINNDSDQSNDNSINNKCDQSTVSCDVTRADSTCLDLKLSVNGIKKVTKNEKHTFSEQQRLLALERKKKSVDKNKDLVKQALENIDFSSSSRIKFGIDEDEDELKDTKKVVNEQKIDLFGSDEESTDESDMFKLKPQFQGEKGEKLFKLHQKFSTDERFKLDERFAEDKDVSKVETYQSSEDVSDDDLKKEKEANLSVLEKLLGVSLEEKKIQNNFKLDRYDPSDINKSMYEVLTDEEKSSSSEDEKHSDTSTQPVCQQPIVSKETFYKVDESLKDLFNGKTKATPTFSFLGSSEDNEDKDKDVTDLCVISEAKQLNFKKAFEMDENAEDDELELLPQHKNLSNKNERFFFTTDDERFKLGKSFVRSSSVEEVTEQWMGIRCKLHETYKKNHKDARRRKFKNQKRN